MNNKFDDKRAFIASVILSGILANSIYQPPRMHKMDGVCADAVCFADCLISKLKETEDAN